MNGADYDTVREGDRIDLLGVTELAPGSIIRGIFTHPDGTCSELPPATFSLNEEQIRWFKAGSALNSLNN